MPRRHRRADLHRQAVVALALLGQLLCAQGQGLYASPTSRGTGTKTFDKVIRYTKEGSAFRSLYAASPENACIADTPKSKSLCSAAPGTEDYTRLVIATSPAVYDARTGASSDYNPIGPVADQRPCQTAVAFAITAAAEAAVASALQINGSSINLSQQDLQFCPGLTRGCYDNWDIKDGLQRLVNGTVVDYECLPYTAAQSDDPAKLCNYRCRDKPKAFVPGKFGFSPIRDVISAQKQIRRYGTFITRFNLYDDFFEWITKTGGSKRDAIYTCPNTNKPPADGHAVAVVGYNNVRGYWVVKNSWGDSNGDKGFFKVKFGTCGMMTAGDTFGVFYIPDKQKPLPVTGAPPSKGKQCYWYKGRKDDYPSKIADRAVVNLGNFLADNTAVIRNLDSPLTGIRMKLCNPDPTSVGVAPKPLKVAAPQPAAAKPPTDPATAAAASKPDARHSSKPEVSPAKDPAVNSEGGGSDAVAAAGVVGPAASTTDAPSASAAAADVAVVEAEALLALKESLGSPAALVWQQGTQPCGDPDGGTPAWNQVYCSKFKDMLQVYLLDLSSLGLSASLGDVADLTSLSRLQAIWMSGNQLSGPLPAGWSKIKTLQEIKLDLNAVTGSLPASWSQLSKLKRLYVNGNKLSGSLPDEWGAWQDLEYLFLASNKLQGTVPSSWMNMTKLSSASLFDNKGLTGCLPFDWNARSKRVKLAAGPESPDGTATLTLTGTCLCGYCTDAESALCDDGTSAAASCSADNSTGAASANGTAAGNATGAGAGSANGTAPADGSTAGDYPEEGPGRNGTEPDPAATGGSTGDGPLAAPPPLTTAPGPGSAGANSSSSGTPGGTAPGAVPDSPNATDPAAGPGANGAAGSSAGAANGTAAVGAPPGVPPVPLPSPAAGIPSFGGLGSGKPVSTVDDPSALVIPDVRKQNLMAVTDPSSSVTTTTTTTSSSSISAEAGSSGSRAGGQYS